MNAYLSLPVCLAIGLSFYECHRYSQNSPFTAYCYGPFDNLPIAAFKIPIVNGWSVAGDFMMTIGHLFPLFTVQRMDKLTMS